VQKGLASQFEAQFSAHFNLSLQHELIVTNSGRFAGNRLGNRAVLYR